MNRVESHEALLALLVIVSAVGPLVRRSAPWVDRGRNDSRAWRLLPHEFPPWRTVYHYFRAWRLNGTWERIHRALRERVRINRDPQPSAGVVGSRSLKTTGVGGEQRGYDGGKKVKGRKCHLLVDTQGLVLKAKVQDREGLKVLVEFTPDYFPHLSHLWMDAGYTEEGKGTGVWLAHEIFQTVSSRSWLMRTATLPLRTLPTLAPGSCRGRSSWPRIGH